MFIVFDLISFFFFNDTATTEIYTLSLHDALPIFSQRRRHLTRQTSALLSHHQSRCISEVAMNDNPKDRYRVFAPGVPNVRVVSERFTSEADAKRYKREILMAYPAA